MNTLKRDSELTSKKGKNLENLSTSSSHKQQERVISENNVRKNTCQAAFRNIKELDNSTVSIDTLRNIGCQNFVALVNNPHVTLFSYY